MLSTQYICIPSVDAQQQTFLAAIRLISQPVQLLPSSRGKGNQNHCLWSGNILHSCLAIVTPLYTGCVSKCMQSLPVFPVFLSYYLAPLLDLSMFSALGLQDLSRLKRATPPVIIAATLLESRTATKFLVVSQCPKLIAQIRVGG